MSDFRKVAVDALKWFPQSRKVVPVTQVRVQFPPSACTVSPGAGRFGIEMVLAGHRAHPAFVTFLHDVETHAREHAARFLKTPGLTWHASVDPYSLVPTFRASAFSDTTFFDAGGEVTHDPAAFGGCEALVELGGAWTSDTHWGLRWKVLEFKDCPAAPPPRPFAFVDDPDDPDDPSDGRLHAPSRAPSHAPSRVPSHAPFAFLDDPDDPADPVSDGRLHAPSHVPSHAPFAFLDDADDPDGATTRPSPV